ncbi:glucokinase [Aquicella lusitana]|uniref:Glucokinase n=1 Tax=Aquicella lusitana TaxID=254246 RepID=A0A370GDG8_9COXI|nr:glucokinase [Aquicella lusitana]RDI41838.1 glucokinase [Aquicella lusitana]VVC73746.1 Glucokinase [Aquicella lusitana]
MSKRIIAWDLGATKCAVALVEYDARRHQLHCKQDGAIKIRTCESLEDLSAKLEEITGVKMAEADAVIIGAAGQFDGEHLLLDKSCPHSGYPYPMGFAELAKQQKWPAFDVIHDYSPIVCATFTSYLHHPENIKHLNNAEINPHGRRVALGVGTGVGLKDGVLFTNGDFWLGTNEMGHIGVTAPPLTDKIHYERHQELIRFLRSESILAEDEPLTFEKLLAGPGIVRIHAFFDRDAKNKSAEEVGSLVREGHAKETLATFAWYLGLLVGTVQLTFMPDGGIWLTGGVILNHMELFDHPDFYHGIESSPTYLKLRQEFPLGVLCGTDHAFMGGAYYASRRLL